MAHSLSAAALDHRYEAPADESALIRAAQRDVTAFDEIYRRYLPRIYSYLLARTDSEQDAADLAAETFLKALDALPTYRERGPPFTAWLFRIAHNTATDFHRRQRRAVSWDAVPEALQPARADGPETALLRREARDRMRAMLADLEPSKRDLIVLRFVAELSVSEIAAVVGKSESAVYKQLSRTLRHLKEQYHDDQ